MKLATSLTEQHVRDLFSAGLRKRMTAREMTLPELVRLVAEQLGSTVRATDRAVRRWLAAEVAPRPRALAALCVVLGCTPADLYSG